MNYDDAEIGELIEVQDGDSTGQMGCEGLSDDSDRAVFCQIGAWLHRTINFDQMRLTVTTG